MENNNKLKDITPETIVGDLLKNFPELEDKLIEKAPVFKKLKNPVLKRTVAKVTSLKQASVIANISIAELINYLRKEAGLENIEVNSVNESKSEKPNWVKEENIKFTYDARIDLEGGIHPAAKVTKEILQLNGDEIYCLITPFVPAPLLDIVHQKGFESFSEKIEADEVYNYIKKLS